MVMVTAQSIDMLTRLNLDKSDCFEMPELDEEDANRLFLYHVSPEFQIKSEDKERILHCVRKCKFQRGAKRGEHFHPLALKVLGAQLGSLGLDPKIWVVNLSHGEVDMFNQFGEKEHPIFSILRRGYDSLSEDDKLLFMDSVVFHPPQRFTPRRLKRFSIEGNVPLLRELDMYEWLSVVHHDHTNIAKIEKQLQGLKAKSLIEDIGDGVRGVIVHDLYLEFAIMEVKRGTLDKRYWVWYNGGEAYPNDLAMTPIGNCWVNVKRVFLRHNPSNKCNQWSGSVEGIKWQHFSNIEVLYLDININEVLGLRGLRCLRSLVVKWGDISHARGKGEGKLDGLGELRNLRWLELWNIHYALCFEEIGCLTKLEVLPLNTNCNDNCDREPLSPPNLEKCIHLREIFILQCKCLKEFPDLSRLRSLRKIVFSMCTSAKEVVGLSSQMHALKQLYLLHCDSLCHIPGLSELVSLQELAVICSQLRQLPNLGKLMKLQLLCIKGKFKQPLGFNGSMPLKSLILEDVEGLPDLGLLRDLQRLILKGFYKSMLPDFGCIIALEELYLKNMLELRELPNMYKLSRLQRLFIYNAPKLHHLVVDDLVGLQHLTLLNCGLLEEKLEIPNINRLISLQSLMFYDTPFKSLPSMNPLTQLRELECIRLPLTEVPDLTGLALLERINLCWCRKFESLGNLENLPALNHLNVAGCDKLKRLPDLKSFKNLRKLDLCHSGVQLSSEDIVALAKLSVSHVLIGDHFQLNILEMMKKVSEESLTEVLRDIASEVLPELFPEVVMKIEAVKLEITFPDVYSACHLCINDVFCKKNDQL